MEMGGQKTNGGFATAMRGASERDRPSLARLKDLDSQQDLLAQLREANALCTHAARAEMVLKWLVQKLNTSQDARVEPESWRTLNSIIRLLSPERLATLLSQDLVGTIKNALQEARPVSDLQPSLVQVLGVLLEISKGPQGTPIKALLSLPATQAASFLGSWLRATYDSAVATAPDNVASVLQRQLHQGLELWALRKHSNQDNETFASECLVPSALLLQHLSDQDRQQLTKRKRKESSAQPVADSRASLESLLARHIFLPARSFFSKTSAQASSKAQKQNGYQGSTSIIQDFLEPLKNSIAKPNEDTQHHLAAISLLLDIALRCSPASTPKQRLQERPWTEAVFEALLDCNKISNGELARRATLVEMLSVIAKRASLSNEKLDKIVESYGELGKGDEKPTDWKLIAQVVELNADLFVSERRAGTLFSALTGATRNSNASLVNGRDTTMHGAESEVRPEDLFKLAKEGIVVPIVKAFSRARKLPTFIELWSKQLQNDEHSKTWSVWLELDNSFKALLEDSLTERQIVDLISSRRDTLAAVSRSEQSIQSSKSQAEISATIVVLTAVLGGVKSDTLVDVLYESIDHSLEHLFDLLQFNAEQNDSQSITLTNVSRIWRLLAKLFELWFPLWAARQVDVKDVKLRLAEMARSGAARHALDAAIAIRRDDNLVANRLDEARDAEIFVARLCSQLNKYDNDGANLWLTESLLSQLDASSLDICLTHPDLLTAIKNEIRSKLFSNWLSAAVRTSVSEHGKQFKETSTIQALCGIATAAAAYAHLDVVETVVEACLVCLATDEHENVQRFAAERVVLEILLTLSAHSLTRALREKTLDAISERPFLAGSYDEVQSQKRLALMIQLMELPNPTAKLSTDPTALWRLAPSHSTDDSNSPSTLNLVDQLTELILKQLLATQDQDRSQDMLVGFSQEVNRHIDVVRDNQATNRHALLCTIIARALQELKTGARDLLKRRLLGESSDRTKDFVIALYDTIQMFTQASNQDYPHTLTPEQMHPYLNALVTMQSVGAHDARPGPDVLPGPISDATKFLQNRFALCVHSSEPAAANALSPLTTALTRVYEISCRHDKLGLLSSEVAPLLLRCNTRPAERKAVISAFEHLVDELDNNAKVMLIRKLLSPEERSTALDLDKSNKQSIGATFEDKVLPKEGVTANDLSLVQSCISKLKDVDIDDSNGFRPQNILTRLLVLAIDSHDLTLSMAACSCILTVLKEKPFLTNQYTIEATLTVMRELLCDHSGTSVLYMDVCRIVSTLLLQYRSRLQGRYHLVIKVFQDLMSCLFSTSKPNASNKSRQRHLKVKHAQALARLLTLFCEPPAQLRKHSKTSELVDESRKEQAHVGKYVQYILHHYCTQVLKGSLGDGVKDALTPGLWSMIEAMQINEADGIKSLSAAMNNNERAVLRGVFEHWRRFGRWRGR